MKYTDNWLSATIEIRLKGIVKDMIWIFLPIAVFMTVVVVLFRMPYSVVKKNFQKDATHYFNQFKDENGLFTEWESMHLPAPVQKHIRICGYLDKPKMTMMKAYIKDAPLKDSNEKPPMIVDYTLCSFGKEPVRLAYIKASMFGIPFEAYDSTQHGVGFMKGVIGKFFTLFNQTGVEMDKAQLLTYLGECFLIPSALLSKYITWEAIDSIRAKATINYKGIIGTGVFTFHEKGFVQSFQTEERAKINTDGSMEYPKWSLIYGDFMKQEDVYFPGKIQTIWHDNDGDCVYFDADPIKFTFDSSEY